MDELTQQNAALAEETSAASANMSDKSENMAQMVGFFKFEHSAAGSPRRSEPDYSPSKPLKTVRSQPAVARQSSKPVNPVNRQVETGNNDEWEEF